MSTLSETPPSDAEALDKTGEGENARLASIRIDAGISIIIPTYREVENIPHILAAIDRLRRDHDVALEVLFMDDDSQDGSVETVAQSSYPWARMVVRTENRGLSPAVVDGFRLARHPVLICMDCDLSHPVETIPAMILALQSGQQLVLGSRYVPGGSTDDDWGLLRWLNSRVATLLAWPLTDVRDPMSGFMAMRRADFEKARDLNPVGYKIALEMIVKCSFENVGEVPIQFSNRQYGESKLNFREQLKYLQHLRRLYIYKFGNAMHFAQFLVVGASGVVVNLTVLSLFLLAGIAPSISLAAGIAVSLVTNFILNRRFSFSYARDRGPWKQFVGFAGASSIGMIINYITAIYLNMQLDPDLPYRLQLAALVGVAAGMVFNFLGNRYVVFRKRHIRE